MKRKCTDAININLVWILHLYYYITYIQIRKVNIVSDVSDIIPKDGDVTSLIVRKRVSDIKE